MSWFRRINLLALVLCFVVVVFGAYVRLSDAGLGCPDWPGCYGHLTVPGAQQALAGAVEAPKAWKEMIHRYLVGILSCLIAAMLVLAWNGYSGSVPRRLVYLLPVVVVVQAVFGALTVTMKLNPLVVTTHLLLGLTSLVLVWLIWLRGGGAAEAEPSGLDPESRSERHAWFAAQEQAEPAAPAKPSAGLRMAAGFGLALLIGQIFLGGWTSSNYAAPACPDFPACQGSYLPRTALAPAFTLWHGADVNYHYGVLDVALRATIHLVHRYGALAVAIVLGLLAGFLIRSGRASWHRPLGLVLLGALVLQIAIGIGMVKMLFPLWLADAHNAGAALLLLTVVALNFFAWKRA
jgi:heme a synthase